MRIISGSTGATAYTHRFESPTQKIAVKAVAVATADVLNTYVQINVVSNTGESKQVTPKVLLGDVLEIAASNEGCVHVVKSGTYTVRGSIELSNFGALDIGSGAFQIQIDGAVATTVWDFFAIDALELTKLHINYNPLFVAANQYKTIDLTNAYAIAVPKAYITELQLQYENGRNSIMVADEMLQITNEVNDISFFYQGIDAGLTVGGEFLTGSNTWYVIGVSHCTQAKVYLSTGANVFVMKDELLS